MSVNMTAFVNIEYSHINKQDIFIENKRKTEKPGRQKTVSIPPGAVAHTVGDPLGSVPHGAREFLTD